MKFFIVVFVLSLTSLGWGHNVDRRTHSATKGHLGASADADSISDLQLQTRLMAPYSFEDLTMFSDRPENYATSDDPNDVYFYLYNNPDQPDVFERVYWNDIDSLKSLSWKKDAPVKVLMHGFTQSQNSSMPGMIKNAYLEAARNTGEPINIIVVDWGRLGGSTKSTFLPIYTRAVRNVKTAGQRTGDMVVSLINSKITSWDQLHLIGFSLGAHVAGWAGNQVWTLTGNKVSRISGLDPAGPLFYLNIKNFNGRDLSKEDAVKVDVIHTSWGSYGKAEVIGHADFYPNFLDTPVQTQPYCLRIISSHRPFQVCSHNMAPVFWSMSILMKMEACKSKNALYFNTVRRNCPSTTTFGENWNKMDLGGFYLDIPKKLFMTLEGFELDMEDHNMESDHSLNWSSSSSSEEFKIPASMLNPVTVSYDCYLVNPKSDGDVAVIHNFRNSESGQHYIFWGGKIKKNADFGIIVPQNPTLSNRFKEMMTRFGIQYSTQYCNMELYPNPTVQQQQRHSNNVRG